MLFRSTNAVPYINTNEGGSDDYEFTVTNSASGSNPVVAWFNVTNATGPLVLVARYGLPLPSLSSCDYLSANAWTASENILVFTNSTPMALTNGNWYLAVVNVAGSNVSYNVAATELFSIRPPLFLYPTNLNIFTNIATIPFSTACLATDLDNPPLPLAFALVSGPTNMTVSTSGLIDWTPTVEQGPTTNGPATNTILVSVTNGKYFVTNSFKVIVLATNLPPAFVQPNQPNRVVIVPGSLVVTNGAVNPNLPDYPLTYALLYPPGGAAIDNNGMISWTPLSAFVGYNFLFTTVVTDYVPAAINTASLSITNSFLVFVEPGIAVGLPQTNTVAPNGGINWVAINVPANALAATNTLAFATNSPVNLWFSTNVPPSITNPNDFDLLPNSEKGVSILTTNSSPANLVPGGIYFLGVQNPNGVAVTYALRVNFLLATGPATNPVPISGIVSTNIGGASDILLTWSAPSNDLFQVQWTTNLVPPVTWALFPGVVSSTNGTFVFTDTNVPSVMKFYELLLLP